MSNGQAGGGPWQSQSQLARQPATLDELRALIEQVRAEILENFKLAMSPVWVGNYEGDVEELNVEPGRIIKMPHPAAKTREEAETFAHDVVLDGTDAKYYHNRMDQLLDFVYGKAE